MLIQELLTQLGFSNRQAQIYKAGLELGYAPASTIAKKSNQNRVTTYQALEGMIEKGICSSSIKDGTTYFEVIHPQQLFEQIEYRTKILKDALPEMMGWMNNFSVKPKIEYFPGSGGLKQVMKQIISQSYDNYPNNDIKTILGEYKLSDEISTWMKDDFLPRRVTVPVKTKTILTSKNHDYSSFVQDKHEYVTVDDENFEISNEIVLYSEQCIAILLLNDTEAGAMVITSKSLYQTFNSFFSVFRKLYKKG